MFIDASPNRPESTLLSGWSQVRVTGAQRKRLWWENQNQALTTEPQFPPAPDASLPANWPVLAAVVIVLLFVVSRLRRGTIR